VLSNTRSKAKTVVGTPYYLSPEIIENMPYSFKSDIWSLGVLLYEMCALCPPFNAQSLHQLAQRIIKGQFEKIPKQYSPGLSNLIAAMLQKDPARRPSVNAILKMPIIERRIGQFLEDKDFKDEFSHTLLHNQDVFKAFARKREDEERAKKQQEELKKK
jgi:NIMA (never in mitosis gene a)-related kinase 1/4/5